MERVQFQQEQMLAELKDLGQKGLFTQKEIKQIMRKRTAFETALVRRIPKKADFLRYAAYEMGLEALRRKRVERLKKEPQPPSISDYALVRRQFHIFERALKKFKGDVGLWIQYIQVAKKEGARTLVGRITARALQLHPNVPALYILAASHELEHLSPSAARVLLQRGIRLNADSVEIWREYVKMELAFVENLRRRWEVLGIDLNEGKSKGKEKSSAEIDEGEKDEEMGDGDAERMEVDAEEEGEDGEAARREIMQGAIVKSVISSAVKALPKISLFTSLSDLIASYPCPKSLRDALLDYLFTLLHTTLPSDPAAIKLSATRALIPDLEGEALIDALKAANERLAGVVRGRGEDSKAETLAAMYAEFAGEWCSKDIDNSLKGYLLTSLQLLAQRKSVKSSPSLLSTTIRLLASHYDVLQSYLPPSINTPEQILRLARKYTGRDRTAARSSAKLWLARLDAEKQLGTSDDEIRDAWDEARGAVEGDALTDVWLWGVERAEASGVPVEERVQLLERLLAERSRVRDATALDVLHETLLLRYAASTHTELSTQLQQVLGSDSYAQGERAAGSSLGAKSTRPSLPGAGKIMEARAARVRRIHTSYLPSARVWKEVFAQEASATDELAAHTGLGMLDSPLQTVYEQWRRKDGVDATVEWARWLLGHARAKEAKDVVVRVRSWLSPEKTKEVERRWTALLKTDDTAGSDV